MTGVTRGARSGQETTLPDDVARRIAIADRARTMVDVLDNPRLGGGIRLVAQCTRTGALLAEKAGALTMRLEARSEHN